MSLVTQFADNDKCYVSGWDYEAPTYQITLKLN